MPLDFTQYGDGWVKEMMQFTKPHLINKLKEAYIKEALSTTHNTASTPVCPKCGNAMAVLSGSHGFSGKVCLFCE